MARGKETHRVAYREFRSNRYDIRRHDVAHSGHGSLLVQQQPCSALVKSRAKTMFLPHAA